MCDGVAGRCLVSEIDSPWSPPPCRWYEQAVFSSAKGSVCSGPGTPPRNFRHRQKTARALLGPRFLASQRTRAITQNMVEVMRDAHTHSLRHRQRCCLFCTRFLQTNVVHACTAVLLLLCRKIGITRQNHAGRPVKKIALHRTRRG